MHPAPPRTEPPPPPKEPIAEEKPQTEATPAPVPEASPLQAAAHPFVRLLDTLQGRGKNRLDNEDIFLLGLIALLLGKEGNEDVLLILTMLLLV